MKLVHLALVVVLGSVLLATSSARADDTTVVVEGPRPEIAHPFDPKVLVTTAAVVTTVSWVVDAAAVFATTSCTGSLGFMGPSDLSCHSYSGWLLLPYVGPTIALFDNINKKTMPGEMPFYAVSTAVNVGALASLIVGVAYPKRDRGAKHASLKPTFETTAHGATVGIGGTF